MFLASQTITHEEIRQLKQDFIHLDKNGDGSISRSELLEQYIRTLDEDEARATVEKVMKEVDTNKNGKIDYTEFLAACMNYSKIASKKNLEAAFKMFDKDSSGDITVDEIKAVLGQGNMDNEFWQDIIREVDQNGDGVIDLKEFMMLMSKKF